MTGLSTVAELRRRLRANAESLSDRYAKRLAVVERLRPWMVGIGVVAALVAACSKIFEGPPGIVMAIVGGALAAMSGLIVASLDYKKLEIGREAEEANLLADQSLSLVEERDAALNAARLLDMKRRERFLAIEQMVESIEAGLIRRADAHAVAETLLRRAIAAIRKAVDYQAPDFFTISIFQRTTLTSGTEMMCRIAAQWTDPERASAGGRDWGLGQGYTGVAWNNARVNPAGDVIEADTLMEHCRTQYPVEHADPQREALYRSVAAIPILVGGTNEVWGVVTATSDRPGVFKRDDPKVTVQNVDMIRDIARIAALLAGLPTVADLAQPLETPLKGRWFSWNK